MALNKILETGGVRNRDTFMQSGRNLEINLVFLIIVNLTCKSIFPFAAVYARESTWSIFSDHVTFFSDHMTIFEDDMFKTEPLWIQISNGSFTTLLVLIVSTVHVCLTGSEMGTISIHAERLQTKCQK